MNPDAAAYAQSSSRLAISAAVAGAVAAVAAFYVFDKLTGTGPRVAMAAALAASSLSAYWGSVLAPPFSVGQAVAAGR